MTEDELRRLIAECDAAIGEDGVNARWAIQCIYLASIARDALRFRHLLTAHSEKASLFKVPVSWVQGAGWKRDMEPNEIRAAIDADMEAGK